MSISPRAIQAVALTIKGRFPNLTVEQALGLTTDIVEVIQAHDDGGLTTGMAIASKLTDYLDANIRRCDHGFIHITCGQCNQWGGR